MTYIRSALNKEQAEAVKSVRSAIVLVQGMNREMGMLRDEVTGLRANLADIQNKYEGIQKDYNKLDKSNGILEASRETFFLVELVKYIVSAAGGVASNYATGGKNWGWVFMAASVLCYGFITWIQTKGTKG